MINPAIVGKMNSQPHRNSCAERFVFLFPAITFLSFYFEKASFFSKKAFY